MKQYTLVLFCMLLAFSCKRKNNEALVTYNDKVVNIVEQADITMKAWNNSDIMQEYDLNKEAAKNKILNLEDSMKAVIPNGADDTLRMAGISLLTNYIQSFNIYDTIHTIITDSIYREEDSIRIQNLMMMNKNFIEQQSATFTEIQRRFAERYELGFMQ